MKIEKLEMPSSSQKALIRLKAFLKRNLVAYGMSALAGLGTGKIIQDTERNITGYNPESHQKVKRETEDKKVNDYEDFIKSQQEKSKKGIMDWFKEKVDKVKKGLLNPKEYIQSTDMYKSLLLKYYDVLKFIDDASFMLPALLMFIMLGGYISRKLKEYQGDPVKKEEMRLIADKINELVEVANVIYNRGIENGKLTEEDIKRAKGILYDAKDSLPNGDEVSLFGAPDSCLPPKLIDPIEDN